MIIPKYLLVLNLVKLQNLKIILKYYAIKKVSYTDFCFLVC